MEAGGTGSDGEQGPADCPFPAGSEGWWLVPVSQCYAWVSQLSLPDPHSLPEPPFPRAPHLPFPETAGSLAHGRLPRGLASSATAQQVPQCGKSPVLSV